jgi:hypothetical protein
VTAETEARPATFDSATAMVAATARFLAGRDFPVLGMEHGDWLRPLLVGLNHLPRPARNWIYRAGSGREGLPLEVVARADGDRIAEQVVGHYPPGPYPAVVIGSSPGSTVHLAAAMGAPVLPQTLLLPVARALEDVDDPAGDIAATTAAARGLLDRNPDLVVHQMFDPCHDRLTLARFAYFRVKRRRLGAAYEKFLRRSLAPGATIFVVSASRGWPVTTLGERHFFQFGGVGDISPAEYQAGSERIRRFLIGERSSRQRWDPPPADDDQPEAEWGFDPELLGDVRRFASLNGLRVVNVAFDEADRLSPLIAEMYRWWYRRLGWSDDRLYVESFVLLDPYWVLRAGAVPYWMTFNTESSAHHLERYLDKTELFSTIDVALVANGLTTPGLASIELWRHILGRASTTGRFAGTDVSRYPSDLASFARYRDVLRRDSTNQTLPSPVRPDDVERFLRVEGPERGVHVGP